MPKIELSREQRFFIQKVYEGKNVLVDACIGSGKTTSIQHLCDLIPPKYSILYLTYNKLLKIDAKEKIRNSNATVTNYHGFVYPYLKDYGVRCGIEDSIKKFVEVRPRIRHYDILIIDEYQDIELELSEMLEYIKHTNPRMQIVAVGDMAQKIYDKTTLDVQRFIEHFLGNHVKLEFTRCFRLSSGIAGMLGRVWHKKIVGVNDTCKVGVMSSDEVVGFLAGQNPSDILCLGARTGTMAKTLNDLESRYPWKFNKQTVYASISDKEGSGVTSPRPTSAIFTTFDSSKGMERKICVIFDYTLAYWLVRIEKPNQKYQILRNIFCVAASRGKERIIFVKTDKEKLLDEKILSDEKKTNTAFEDVDISGMFDFKYIEDVERSFSYLKITTLNKSNELSEIAVINSDGLIDLSPCIGTYQESLFFKGYDIQKDIDLWLDINKNKSYLYTEQDKAEDSLDRKILFLTSLETRQNRYLNQVDIPFVNENEKQQIIKRLSTIFSPYEEVQVACQIDFSDSQNGQKKFAARGICDVLKGNIVYELKFVSELTHTHFLQCACYMYALGLEKGVVWNVHNNEKCGVEITDREGFLDAVVKTVTKGVITKYYPPSNAMKHKGGKNIAVLDVETTYNYEVQSIGVIIANRESLDIVDHRYYILLPYKHYDSMFGDKLYLDGVKVDLEGTRDTVSKALKQFLLEYGVKEILAYNASFDKKHMTELSEFIWYDIMKMAKYRKYNPKIPPNADCYKTGALKRGYGVEPMYKMLSGDKKYSEQHNALTDALDELHIMRMLGLSINMYKEI